MNITLSAEKELIKKTRHYATQHGTTLNQMIRTFMKNLTGSVVGEDVATEFTRLARDSSGCSPKGYAFDRSDAHLRK